MRYRFIALCIALVCATTAAPAQVSVHIGINVPAYPQLVPVPGYPVYYAPSLRENYFFYDGMYWVFEGDNWHASSWYNGPWQLMAPEYVPVYVLRVPVRYYRAPPPYFRAWQPSAPPRWGHHWGPQWEQRHKGWDKWNRHAVPPPAPLPTYQRRYSGERYPRAEQQQAELQSRNYRYQPQSDVARQHYKQQDERRAAGPSQRELKGAHQQGGPMPQDGKVAPQERGRDKGKDKDKDKGREKREEGGQGHNK